MNSFNFQNARNKTRTISVTSGKGGVGKTTLIANLALCLAQQDKKVLILDGDLGLANVDIMFGVRPDGSLQDIIAGRKEMSDILTDVAKNISLIPGGSGLVDFNNLNYFERRAMIEAVSAIPHSFDYLLIDTAPGISDNVLFLNSAAQTVSVVVTPDPASFADAYALIKLLHQNYKMKHFSIICNQVRAEDEGLALYKRFNDVVTKFLHVGLDYWGSIPQDAALRRANHQQRLIVKHESSAPSAQAIKKLSCQIELMSHQLDVSGGMGSFWNQIVGTA